MTHTRFQRVHPNSTFLKFKYRKDQWYTETVKFDLVVRQLQSTEPCIRQQLGTKASV